MPRHPRNTKRGSSVLLRKRQQERKWHVALTEKAAHRAFPLRRIASLHCLPYKALCKRWRRFLAAELTGRCCAGMEASRTCAHGRTQSPPSTTHTRQFCAASFWRLNRRWDTPADPRGCTATTPRYRRRTSHPNPPQSSCIHRQRWIHHSLQAASASLLASHCPPSRQRQRAGRARRR